MGGHDHHKPPFVVPDPNIYKIENAPELVKVQKALAEKGLKDPWLRNEVWRYERKHWGTRASRLIQVVTRGARIGIPLFLLTIGIEQVFGLNQGGHGHGHGHANHDSEHAEHH